MADASKTAKAGDNSGGVSAPSPSAAVPAPAGADVGAALNNLKFRNIGPAVMGGRIDDYAVVDSNVIYVGTAAGGVFKTINGGTTWTPIMDHALSSSIGAIAVMQSDPSIVWVGTGEANNRQSASWGAGVYKSVDAGKTWQLMGLENTNSIGAVVIDPRDPDTVYIAALGDQWAASRDRGVYKTTDGGKTWTQSLFISENTGVSDIAMDLQSPGTLYAGAYERRRTVWGFDGGGPEGGIYKTTDGGKTWTKLTNGLPYTDGGDVGRTGLSVYRRNPNIVYARLQHAKGGIFRSEDKGSTWTRMSDFNPRPNYFGGIAVDPNNDLRVWADGTDLFYSEDGGKTFAIRSVKVHYDKHALWIDPHDSDHVIVGTDGGIYFSRDRGHSWVHNSVIDIGQFYEVTANNEEPYKVCGGLQDNGSWCGPSNSLQTRGITNYDWVAVESLDGFYNRLDPVDPNIDYVDSQGGDFERHDFRTSESRRIKPREKPGEAPYRFEWNSPIEISAHDHRTIYVGGNFLFKSTNRGDTWTKISPDLTNNENRTKMPILGQLPNAHMLSLFDGVSAWPCITVIGESPMSAQLIYVGTDDGNLQVTRDGGKTWANVADRIPGVPRGTYVSRVVASKYVEGTAYAAFDGHRSGDYHIYLFNTTDYGRTWKPISDGITERDGTLHVVREDPRVQNILYAGTERGLFISYDHGANWMRIQMNLPTVPVDDILIHPRDNDMILGTHGRSIWILDDITPIQQLNQEVIDSSLHLFDIRPAFLFRMKESAPLGFGFGSEFEGQNPPYGALIDFYLKDATGENDRLIITISDSSGKRVREIRCPSGEAREVSAASPNPSTCSVKPGIDRVAWDLRYDPPAPPQREGAGGGGGLQHGPLVEPGQYSVKLTLASQTQTKTVRVEEDPRIQISPSDRAAWHSAIMKAYDLAHTILMDQRQVNALKANLDATLASWKRPGAPKIPDNVQKAAEDLSKQVNAVQLNYAAGFGEGGGGAAAALRPRRPASLTQRVTRLLSGAGIAYGGMESFTAAPTSDDLDELNQLDKEVPAAHEQVRKLVDVDVANLNNMMNKSGMPHIDAAAPVPGRRAPEEEK